MEIDDLAIEAFIAGYAKFGETLTPRANNALQYVRRYAPLAFGYKNDVQPIGAIQHAAIAVKAKDTGRLLMQQRSLHEQDEHPSAGMWEFPGGRVEPEETPWETACREWHEETGIVLPPGEIFGEWLTPNGVSQGFAYLVDSESDVKINLDPDKRRVFNPDDPDGDFPEVMAWWEPNDVLGMSALRPEVRTGTDWRLLGVQQESANPFEIIESVGELTGLRDQLFMRRDRLWMDYDHQARDWARRLSLVTPIDRLVVSMTDAYNAVTEEKALTKNRRDAAKAAALALLQHTLQAEDHLATQSRSMTAAALGEGRAEGYTSGSALGALHAGRQVPNLDNLKQDALTRIKRLDSYQKNGAESSNQQVSSLAGDLAIALGAMIAAGASTSDMEDAAQEAIAEGDGAAFSLDGAIHSAYIQGQLAQYQQDQVQYLAWTTVGDERVCPACEALEAGNPYIAQDAPEPPEHGNCRCWLEPTDGP